MKILTTLCLLVIFGVNTAFAIAPLNQNLIKQAHLYGSSQARAELNVFLKPWVSYEEKAENLNETSEAAYLYTPFLLIAMDAREKKLHNQLPRLEDSEKIITDYLDTLSFSVNLSGSTANFSSNTTAVLQQKGKIIKSWHEAIPTTAEPADKSNTKYEVQAYFYFDERELDLHAPVTLLITTGDKKTHRFYFELSQVK